MFFRKSFLQDFGLQHQKEEKKMKHVIAATLTLCLVVTLAGLLDFGTNLSYSIAGIVLNYMPVAIVLILFNYSSFNLHNRFKRYALVALSVIMFLTLRLPALYGLTLLFNSLLIARIIMTIILTLILSPLLRNFRL